MWDGSVIVTSPGTDQFARPAQFSVVRENRIVSTLPKGFFPFPMGCGYFDSDDETPFGAPAAIMDGDAAILPLPQGFTRGAAVLRVGASSFVGFGYRPGVRVAFTPLQWDAPRGSRVRRLPPFPNEPGGGPRWGSSMAPLAWGTVPNVPVRFVPGKSVGGWIGVDAKERPYIVVKKSGDIWLQVFRLESGAWRLVADSESALRSCGFRRGRGDGILAPGFPNVHVNRRGTIVFAFGEGLVMLKPN